VPRRRVLAQFRLSAGAPERIARTGSMTRNWAHVSVTAVAEGVGLIDRLGPSRWLAAALAAIGASAWALRIGSRPQGLRRGPMKPIDRLALRIGGGLACGLRRGLDIALG
jgi:hypothetical protein